MNDCSVKFKLLLLYTVIVALLPISGDTLIDRTYERRTSSPFSSSREKMKNKNPSLHFISPSLDFAPQFS